MHHTIRQSRFLLMELTVLWIGCFANAQQQQKPPPPIPSFSSLHANTIGEALLTRPMVRATVINRRIWRGLAVSRQRIDHVYCGPKELLGQEFEDTSVMPPGGILRGGAYYASPPLEVGQAGIWMLVLHDSQWLRAPRWGQLYWPVREDFRPDYDGYRELAVIIETVNAAPNDSRLAMIEVLIESEVDEIAYWAIQLLSETNIKTLRNNVAGFIPSARSRILNALDWALWEHDRDWWSSQEGLRFELLDQMIEFAKHDFEDATRFLLLIDGQIQSSRVDAQEAFDRISPFVLERTYETAVRERAMASLGRIAKDRAVRQQVVSVLNRIRRTGDESDRLKSLASRLIRQANNDECDSMNAHSGSIPVIDGVDV